MAREQTSYECQNCGWRTVKWVGRCGHCQEWDSLVAQQAAPASGNRANHFAAAHQQRTPGAVAGMAQPITELTLRPQHKLPTGVEELDRVLGGGLTPASVTLVAGEPGIGKSTLLLDAAARLASANHTVLYLSGEEAVEQIHERALRINALADQLYLASVRSVPEVAAHIAQLKPGIVIVDSVQTIDHPESTGTAGGVAQVREVTAELTRAAKEYGFTLLLVGHVTKDGAIAGPRTLEHVVDVVLQIEGDRHTRLRLLRALKNRYGPADEVGCFQISDDGLWAMPDPSGLFLSRLDRPSVGSATTATLSGARPLLAEVQSLLGSAYGNPRRTVHGLSSNRVAMILAVLEQHAHLPIRDKDVYVSTIGGANVTDPSADLAIALSLASSLRQQALPQHLLLIGEIGLTGDLRPATGVRARLREAARLGFTSAIFPASQGRDLAKPRRLSKPTPANPLSPSTDRELNIECFEVTTIHEALLVAGLMADSPTPGPVSAKTTSG